MPNLKEVRERISSVNSTKQITSAMKMVSAAKLKQAQDAIVQIRPYAGKIGEILSNLVGSVDMSETAFSAREDVNKVLFVVINSNRGLCGGFNSQVIKLVNRELPKYEGQHVDIMTIGKKAYDVLKKTGKMADNDAVPAEANNLYDHLDFDHVGPVADQIMKAYTDGVYDKVVLLYNRFKNAATQLPTAEQWLPVVTEEVEDTAIATEYIFEPSKEEIMDEVLPKSLKIQFYKALLDSYASEHGARMTAMHKATDNASELLKELKLTYNKARQAAITNEILEIVGGAEALNG